jgi:hypothetical protein
MQRINIKMRKDLSIKGKFPEEFIKYLEIRKGIYLIKTDSKFGDKKFCVGD